MSQVLLLNASYEPLHVCSWKRAVTLLHKGKAISVEHVEGRPLGHGYELPLVIRLLQYVKIPHKDVSFTRKNILHRDHYACQYCGCKSDLTIDHVVPRSRGGADDWLNVTTACIRCNVKKGCRTPEEAHMPLARQPFRPYSFLNFEISKHKRMGGRHLDRWQQYLFF